jgi:hypothetical protein
LKRSERKERGISKQHKNEKAALAEIKATRDERRNQALRVT